MFILPLIFAWVCSGQPPEPTKPPITGRYIVLKVSGDLDSEQLASSFSAELDSLKDARLLIIELDGNRSRLDLVAKLGARIKACTTPTSILLKDSVDKKVGLGQLLLGAYAKSCFIDPATQVAATPTDDLRILAPAATSWESIEREVSGSVWTRLGDRSADQSIARALIAPHEDWWVIPGLDPQPWKLSATSPAGGQSGPAPHQIIWATTAGPTRISIPAESAAGLRLCTAQTKTLASILADATLSIRSARTNRSISSGLNDAAATLPRIVDDAKLAARKVATTLTIKSTPSRPTPIDDYRKAGKSALDQIELIQKTLDRADSLLADFPELERRQSPAPKKLVWKPAIEEARKDLEKHRLIARDFATR